MFIREIKNLCGRLLVMMRRKLSSQIEMYFLKGVLSKWRSLVSRVDWLSEEKYNIYKEDFNNMPKKKKKVKKKAKKKNKRKTKKRR
jgi:hypothetical protein